MNALYPHFGDDPASDLLHSHECLFEPALKFVMIIDSDLKCRSFVNSSRLALNSLNRVVNSFSATDSAGAMTLHRSLERIRYGSDGQIIDPVTDWFLSFPPPYCSMTPKTLYLSALCMISL